MSTTANAKTEAPDALETGVLARILDEGYGPGAWHGADLKAALEGVAPELAFWRPAPERHNIAEIAIHHAYYAHSVRERLTGPSPEPFALEGDDWFALPDGSRLAWPAILSVVDAEQQRLASTVAQLGDGRARSPLTYRERLDLILGITCHAVYHAGQVQLIKRLHAK
jgi:hypothetical protein